MLLKHVNPDNTSLIKSPVLAAQLQ
uniref:Uncharacterized protein n=1 Tax=Anguilla anguilla TaxID=7936 RepID=A0A0E9VJV7_ANGAN